MVTARFWVVVVALAAAVGPSAAQSFDYTYEWNYQVAFLANNATLEIPAGTTFQLSVYVRETGGGNVGGLLGRAEVHVPPSPVVAEGPKGDDLGPPAIQYGDLSESVRRAVVYQAIHRPRQWL